MTRAQLAKQTRRSGIRLLLLSHYANCRGYIYTPCHPQYNNLDSSGYLALINLLFSLTVILVLAYYYLKKCLTCSLFRLISSPTQHRHPLLRGPSACPPIPRMRLSGTKTPLRLECHSEIGRRSHTPVAAGSTTISLSPGRS